MLSEEMYGAQPIPHIPDLPSPPDWLVNMWDYSIENYLLFDSVMKKHGYAWEPIKVPTEDGYTLTAFHVTGKIAADGTITTVEHTEAPVFVQHGLGSDAATWLWSYTSGVPLPLQLYDQGFDVFMGNSRGTYYS